MTLPENNWVEAAEADVGSPEPSRSIDVAENGVKPQRREESRCLLQHIKEDTALTAEKVA